MNGHIENDNMEHEEMEDTSSEEEMEKKKEELAKIRRQRLGKRLAYILRYGAEKEGLDVQEGGYIELMALLRVPLLQRHRPEEVLQEIDESMSYRGIRRFEKKYEHGTIYVRAPYGRRMERNPNHEDSGVPRLLEMCMSRICDNIKDYDLEDFPDEFLLNTMIHRLKRQKRLTNKAMECILGPNIEHLDLTGVYLTESTIKLIGRSCPKLKVLNLHDCGYVMTDHFMEILLKKVQMIESINVSSCRHLTDRTLRTFVKRLPGLMHVNAANCPNLTQEGILDFLISAPKLQHLDIFDSRALKAHGKETLVEIARECQITVVLRGLTENGVAPPDGPNQHILGIWKNAHT